MCVCLHPFLFPSSVLGVLTTEATSVGTCIFLTRVRTLPKTHLLRHFSFTVNIVISVCSLWKRRGRITDVEDSEHQGYVSECARQRLVLILDRVSSSGKPED